MNRRERLTVFGKIKSKIQQPSAYVRGGDDNVPVFLEYHTDAISKLHSLFPWFVSYEGGYFDMDGSSSSSRQTARKLSTSCFQWMIWASIATRCLSISARAATNSLSFWVATTRASLSGLRGSSMDGIMTQNKVSRNKQKTGNYAGLLPWRELSCHLQKYSQQNAYNESNTFLARTDQDGHAVAFKSK